MRQAHAEKYLAMGVVHASELRHESPQGLVQGSDSVAPPLSLQEWWASGMPNSPDAKCQMSAQGHERQGGGKLQVEQCLQCPVSDGRPGKGGLS
jgi:hypothetical protein